MLDGDRAVADREDHSLAEEEGRTLQKNFYRQSPLVSTNEGNLTCNYNVILRYNDPRSIISTRKSQDSPSPKARKGNPKINHRAKSDPCRHDVPDSSSISFDAGVRLSGSTVTCFNSFK